MIRQLQRIRAFGSFHDFSWPNGLYDFKKCNLIFGWNYSGKTTLSRTLRCFELMKAHADFATAEVQICVEGGTVHHLSRLAAPHLFRVFNVDYVWENIQFDSGRADAILVVGAEDIAKQNELVQDQTDLAQMVLDHVRVSDAHIAKREALDAALTARARDIKNDLNRPNYDRLKFEPRVEERKDDFAANLLSANDLQRHIGVYRSDDKKDTLSAKTTDSLSSITALKAATASLLSKTVTANTPIDRLSNDAEVEQWVRRGRVLHEGKDDCQFCGQILPAGLLTAMDAHFSAEYNVLMQQLATQLTALNNARDEKLALDHRSDFYPDQADQFQEIAGRLEVQLQSRREHIERLIAAVNQKQLKAFTSMTCPDAQDNASEIAGMVREINAVINMHNARTLQFEENREAVFATLERHYAATFVQDNKYSDAIIEIATLKANLDNHARRMSGLAANIKRLERELSDAVKGADTINGYLHAFFGKPELQIVVANDNRFQITRNGHEARNLSEGERTAIAFAYFMTRLLDGKNKLTDTVVVIDDPIGSLDANHLFHVYALIKTQLADCLQLFILTHNFEFYHLIREWAFDRNSQPKKEDWSMYQIRRPDTGHSVLEAISPQLRRFNSEYHYLFDTLLKFEGSNANDFDSLMSLPNLTRRFIEAFCGVMMPTRQNPHEKINRLIDSPVEAECVYKFVNTFSHNQTQTRSLKVPDFSECKHVVAACLNAIRAKYPDYYRDLESSIQ